MAARERVLRASARSEMRRTRQVSKACWNIRSLASVLMPVPWACAESQVAPISAASGTASAPPVSGPRGAGGHTTGPSQ